MGYKSAKQRNYLQAQDKLNEEMIDLHIYDPRLTEESGIYILTRMGKPREDGTVRKCVYVGQAQNMLQRLGQHLFSFKEVDISLRHRGLYYSHSNPYGWKIQTEYCSKEMLNEREKYWIDYYKTQEDWEVYNVTSGGQDEGHTDIRERKASKGYRDGLEQGYKNAIKDVKEFFDKYLRFTVTNKPDARKKAGQYKELYVKKYNEFKELLYGKNEEE